MVRLSCLSLSLLLFACAAQKPAGPDPMVMLDARLQSLEAQLLESKATQERLAQRLETAMTERTKSAPAKKASTPRGKMRKSSNLPITRLTPGGQASGESAEEGEAGEDLTERVVDSRHEGLHIYRQGVLFLKDRKFEEAIERFRKFLTENPEHVYADRAQYLMTEALYGNKEYGLVIVAAQLLESKYPFSFRIPEACYYRAMALLSMGQRPQATDALKDVMKRFPREPVAETASRKLAELSVTRRSHEDVPLLPDVGT
jgi:TolA-binding protein